MNILVVRLDHLGDLLLTTPMIRALAHAGHTVDVLVKDSLRPIFERSPYVGENFGIEEICSGFPRRWWRLGRWMRTRKYDVIILAYAKERRLCFASAFSGAKRKLAMWAGVWGRVTGHECLPSHMLDRPRPVSEILLACAATLGAPAQGLVPDLFISEEELAAAHALIPPALKNRPLVGIHPGSAGNACNLPSAVYGRLAEALLRETDFGVIVTGVAGEKPLLASWSSAVLASDRVWNAMGLLDVRTLAGVISATKAYVCSSTGPLHVASAMRTRTVSPFCPVAPLNAALWGNIGAPSRVLEPTNCPRQREKCVSCTFEGEIDERDLFDAIQAIFQGEDEILREKTSNTASTNARGLKSP